jgi:hypothetical protein
MAINAKVTFIFNDGRAGWSETWYLAAIADLATAARRAVTLAESRRELLARGVSLEYVRTSDEDVLGDSLVAITRGDVAGGTVAGGLSPDTPYNAILVRAQAGALYRRQVWLRGVPDDWIRRNAADPPFFQAPQQRTALAAFFAELAKAPPFAIRAIAKEAAVTVPRRVTGVTFNAGTGRWVLEIGAHGFANNDQVRVRGAKPASAGALNGVFGLTGVTGTAVEITPSPADGGIVGYLAGSATIAKRVIQYYPINFGLAVRYAKRATGRAFFVPHGRRRAR